MRTPAPTLAQHAAARHFDAWVWWISTARPANHVEQPWDTDARDTYYTTRDAFHRAQEQA